MKSIRTKMILGFTVLIFFSLTLTILSGTQLIKIGNDGFHTVTDNLQTLEYLNKMQSDYNNILIHLKNTYFADSDESRDYFKNITVENTASFYEQAQNYLDFIADKNNTETLDKMNELISYMDEHTALREEAFRLSYLGNSTGANNYSTNTIMPVGNEIYRLLTELYADSVEGIENIAVSNYDSARRITLIVMVVGVLSVLVSCFMAIKMTRDVTVPVKQLIQASHNLSKGNFQINLKAYQQDELGVLTNDIGTVVTTFRKFMDDMKYVMKKQMEGDIDALIDISGFEGDFKEFAQGFNTIITLEKDTLEDIINTVTNFLKGNFDTDIPQLPGKKAIFSQHILEMKENFESLSSEINNLLQHAIEGDLTYRVDSSTYHGDWAQIIVNINNLLEAMTKPIEELQYALKLMSQGQFENIAGNYKGDYAAIKDAMNQTQQILSNYIEEISYTLRELSRQNLDISIQTQFLGVFSPIRESLELIVSTFNTLVFELGIAAKKVADGTRYLSEASIEDSKSLENQYFVVRNLSDSMESIHSKTKMNAEISAKANQLMEVAKNATISGNEQMNQMLFSMSEINQSSDDIFKIIQVIDDIAFQTNLLALNAAVEASRAGDRGKGFAIVAEEVRNLSARSAEAARESSLLIEKSIANVQKGSKIANDTATTLKNIEIQMNDVSDKISQIMSFSKDQEGDIDAVNKDIGGLAVAAQNASITSQEKVEAVSDISTLADQLDRMVTQFHLKQK